MVDCAGTYHWVQRYGPYLSLVLGARLSADRVLAGADPAENLGSCSQLALFATAVGVLSRATDLLAAAPPLADRDCEHARAAAIEALRAAAASRDPFRRVGTARALLAEADRHLLRLGDRLTPAAARPGAVPRPDEVRYSDGT